MYSKIYNITCDPVKAVGLMEYYDSTIADAVRASAHHVGHQMIEVASGRWLLISNYHSKKDAEEASQMVQDLVAPMIENFGMTLETVAEGETIREIS